MNTTVLEQIIENPIPYAHQLGYNLLTDIHAEWIRKFFFITDNFTHQAHRDSYKTTCLGIALGLRMIGMPQKNTILFRKDEPATKEVLRSVRKDLDSDIVRSLVKDIYDTDLKMTIDGATELQTNLYRGPKECQLLGKGIKNSVTGLHGDILSDDIINLKDRVSEAERNYTKTVIQEMHNIAGKYGKIGNNGTPWHKDDGFTLMPTPEKHTVYNTGIFTPEEIDEKKGTMTGSMFACNYELKHIADGDVLFTEPSYGAFPIGAKAYGQIDAAYGGADRTALTIMTEVDGNYHVIGKLLSGHVDQHYNLIVSMLERYQVIGCALENNADKGFLKKELSKKTDTPLTGYHEKMNKYYKISTYGKSVWNRVILDIDNSDLEYISEIMDFNENASHDDAPDSFASLVRWKYKKKKVQYYI